MPTIILLDASLSMSRNVSLSDASEPEAIKTVGVRGLAAFLDQVYSICKLEFSSLMVFSSLYEKTLEFTRDHERIKDILLTHQEYYDKTDILNALIGARDYVLEEWGPSCPLVNIILVTDGELGIPSFELDFKKMTFGFPCKLHVVLLAPTVQQSSINYFSKLITDLGLTGQSKDSSSSAHKSLHIENQILVPETLSMKSVYKIFQKLAEQNYQTWKGNLKCGNLSSPVTVYPPLEHRKQIGDFEVLTAKPSGDLSIIGFMDIQEVASPPVLSRHLVFSLPMTKEQMAGQHSIFNLLEKKDIKKTQEVVADPDDHSEDGKQPSLCVLLHGSLKVEGMVAICTIGQVSSYEGNSSSRWFGILYSWADSKKKFNLMLSTLDFLNDSIPWLCPFEFLGHPEVSTKLPASEGADRRKGKRSYHSQSTVVWIRNASLQQDIQKIVRLAKRLPEKSSNFYKELSRFRKAAASFGFYEIMAVLAVVLEREANSPPTSANPEAIQHLQYGISVLRSNESYDIDIPPLR
jgi:hypothetical protein